MVMLILHANNLVQLTETVPGIGISRITTNPCYVEPLRHKETYLSQTKGDALPEGFGAYLVYSSEVPNLAQKKNVLQIGRELSYLQDGDIIKINPQRKLLRVLYRNSSHHNVFLLTERCNHYCIMCSQPPRNIDDSFLLEDIFETLPLITGCPKEIGLSGGEPTVLGDRLITLLQRLKSYLPRTAVHMLTNGSNFKDIALAEAVSKVQHPDLMLGIPIYSDIAEEHDFIVQCKGAFADTMRGILNLKSLGVRIELRVVIIRQNYAHLRDLAQFIRRNLTFCDHVAFMGMEIEGFANSNLDDLWIDPYDYRTELTEATEALDWANMAVSIYNLPLCLLAEKSRLFSRQSISDWKNEFVAACENCAKRKECCGFFKSGVRRLSDHIRPFV